jgi:hypothetical protein
VKDIIVAMLSFWIIERLIGYRRVRGIRKKTIDTHGLTPAVFSLHFNAVVKVQHFFTVLLQVPELARFSSVVVVLSSFLLGKILVVQPSFFLCAGLKGLMLF